MTAMRPRPRFEDKIADWQRAFWIIEAEIDGKMMEIGPAERLANRRTAALAAAVLMAGSVRPGSVVGEADRG